jgi:GAF domain-containing protein
VAIEGLSDLRLKDDRDAIARIVEAEQQYTIDIALEAARERLGMDVAYATTVTPTVQRFDAGSGATHDFGLEPGTEVPIEMTYCKRMLGGLIPNVVPDTSREPAVQDLPVTKLIGAYVGVPVVLSGGRTHGTLCAASAEPRSNVGDDELQFMRLLAQLVATRIERAEGRLT